MAILIIIRGNSGSGKTSTAKALQKKLGRNTLLISQDMVRREMLYAKDGKETDALPLLLTLLNYGNEHCRYVILEGILNSEWYRLLFEQAAETFENRVCAYYYDIPFEETLRRHETKEKRFEFGEAEMRRWWKEKDFIGIIPEKIFNEDISSKQAVEIICKDINEVKV